MAVAAEAHDYGTVGGCAELGPIGTILSCPSAAAQKWCRAARSAVDRGDCRSRAHDTGPVKIEKRASFHYTARPFCRCVAFRGTEMLRSGTRRRRSGVNGIRDGRYGESASVSDDTTTDDTSTARARRKVAQNVRRQDAREKWVPVTWVSETRFLEPGPLPCGLLDDAGPRWFSGRVPGRRDADNVPGQTVCATLQPSPTSIEHSHNEQSRRTATKNSHGDRNGRRDRVRQAAHGVIPAHDIKREAR